MTQAHVGKFHAKVNMFLSNYAYENSIRFALEL